MASPAALHTILVVEDEAHIRELVSYTLQGAGYHVQAVADGESAIRAFARSHPDLVLLDIRLPGMDGWEVCRQVRAQGNVPVLFLTALSDEQDVVKGLRIGADDYLTKPFSPAVLAARVQALLRRAEATGVHIVEIEGLTINLSAAEVRRHGERVPLTSTEFRLLATLASRLGQVVSPGELTRSVQGYELPDAEAQVIVKVHVRHIRRKIEPDPEHPRYLLTVRGLGYMLSPVHAEPSTAEW